MTYFDLIILDTNSVKTFVQSSIHGFQNAFQLTRTWYCFTCYHICCVVQYIACGIWKSIKYAQVFAVLYCMAIRISASSGSMWYISIFEGFYIGDESVGWLPQCRWSNPEGYGYKWPYQTITKHSNLCPSLLGCTIIIVMYQKLVARLFHGFLARL